LGSKGQGRGWGVMGDRCWGLGRGVRARWGWQRGLGGERGWEEWVVVVAGKRALGWGMGGVVWGSQEMGWGWGVEGWGWVGWGSGWGAVGGWGWGWVVGQGRERGGAGAGGKVWLELEVGVGGWGWCRCRRCCRRCCCRVYLGYREFLEHLGCQGHLRRVTSAGRHKVLSASAWSGEAVTVCEESCLDTHNHYFCQQTWRIHLHRHAAFVGAGCSSFLATTVDPASCYLVYQHRQYGDLQTARRVCQPY
jgi:hypothetical protein